MDFFNSPINKEEQLEKIIEDTDEIIKNFKEITEIMTKRLYSSHDLMHNLGRRVVHHRADEDESSENLGTDQVKFI